MKKILVCAQVILVILLFNFTMATASDTGGVISFSSKRLSKAEEGASNASFKTGDPIYAFIQLKTPWKSFLTSNMVVIRVKIDGKKTKSQTFNIKDEAFKAGTSFQFGIAPKKGDVKTYARTDIEWGRKGKFLAGPMMLTDYFAKLSPGKHAVNMEATFGTYGPAFAAGDFTIEGQDFSSFKSLNAHISQVIAGGATMPAPRKTDKSLSTNMKKLLKAKGWPKVYRLNIVDKDWWVSPTYRHIEASAMAKDGKGYYYSIVTFKQPKLLSGGYGKLEVLKTGNKIRVDAKNKDK